MNDVIREHEAVAVAEVVTGDGEGGILATFATAAGQVTGRVTAEQVARALDLDFEDFAAGGWTLADAIER